MAGRLTEMYHKPSAVFTLHDGHYVGSLRAPAGIDLVKVLELSSAYLTRFGGHAGAAGCTIEAGNIEKACNSMKSAADELMQNIDTTPTIHIDTVLDPLKINLNTLSEIDALRPFGVGFSAPLFLLSGISVPVRPLGQTGEHIRWDMP